MKPPIFVRELSEKEREELEAGLRSKDAFVMRRCQILLASARGLSPPKIAESLGCASQTVRNAVRAFNKRGLTALTAIEGGLVIESNDALTNLDGLAALTAVVGDLTVVENGALADVDKRTEREEQGEEYPEMLVGLHRSRLTSSLYRRSKTLLAKMPFQLYLAELCSCPRA